MCCPGIGCVSKAWIVGYRRVDSDHFRAAAEQMIGLYMCVPASRAGQSG